MQSQENSKLTILIVDDDQFVTELLSARLKRDGFGVATAMNHAEAISRIIAEKPALMVLDLDLEQKGEGLAILDEIRQNNQLRGLPIIVLSNTGSEDEMERAGAAGADLYLVKAYVDREEIVFRIKNVLQKHRVGLPFFNKKFAFSDLAELKQKIELDLKKNEKEINISDLVDHMTVLAFLSKASDIHIEPAEKNSIVRFRIDGVMQDFFTIPKSIHGDVLMRVKSLAGLRTGETDLNQEGHFRSQVENPPQQFEVRVSTLSTYFGENIVLRLLSKELAVSTLDDLLLSETDIKKINKAIEKPVGMILITGPTGSGKSTTLYTILRKLNTRHISIISIEDPVEYPIEGIQQIQVNPRIGLTFATGLRSILRQDPDIIMVGEIRDRETAGIAINAALTGHLLLSTIHTSDAATTLPRLLDMGIESFLVASTVTLAISQRLVRQICPKCRVEKKITAEELAALSEKLPIKIVEGHKTFFYGKGCTQCGGTGYEGRLGVYEVLEMSDPIRETIMKRANSEEIRKVAMKNGMTTILEDGFRKALKGLTTIEEILRVIHE